MMLIVRSSDCAILTHKLLPLHDVKSCCVAAGCVWAVTADGMVVVISGAGDVMKVRVGVSVCAMVL